MCNCSKINLLWTISLMTLHANFRYLVVTCILSPVVAVSLQDISDIEKQEHLLMACSFFRQAK